MADRSSSNEELDLDALFNESSGDEFEGFHLEDIVYGNTITKLPITDFSPQNDRDDQSDLNSGWTRNDTPPTNAPFTGISSLNVEMDNYDPVSMFKLFITDDFIELLANQTNIYAASKDLVDKEFSRQKKWRPVDSEEMKLFLALVIAMGLVKKDDIQDYWDTDEIQATVFFGANMSRDRFLGILSNFHLSDNNDAIGRGQVGFDPLFKIRPFITLCMKQFSDVYSPERDLSFDEATCAWKGRLRFKVYNPAKPTRFGVKLYQVCEAKSGYCLGFNIYTGSEGENIDEFAELVGVDDECTHTTKLVIGLLARCGLLDKGHHVYMDNYYTSPELFSELDLNNTYACGTVRKNRKGVPEAIKSTKLTVMNSIFRRKENLLAVKFHDKRDVYMLSSIHEATMSVLNKRDYKTNSLVTKPTCIVEYTKLMGGVDLSDQINKNYSCLRKSSKWYKKVFFHLLNVCVINAYLLYLKFYQGEKKENHRGFCLSLCRALMEESARVPRPQTHKGRKSLEDQDRRLTERHFPDYIPAKPGAKRARPMRDCVACNKKGKKTTSRKQTAYWCPDCKKALCVPTCFRVYHTIKNYRSVLLPENANEHQVSTSESDPEE